MVTPDILPDESMHALLATQHPGRRNEIILNSSFFPKPFSRIQSSMPHTQEFFDQTSSKCDGDVFPSRLIWTAWTAPKQAQPMNAFETSQSDLRLNGGRSQSRGKSADDFFRSNSSADL